MQTRKINTNLVLSPESKFNDQSVEESSLRNDCEDKDIWEQSCEFMD